MNKPYSDNLIINETTLPVISQLTERIPGGFFIYHAYGSQELIYFNSYLPSIFGCQNEDEFIELVGNSFKGIVHPEDYETTEISIREQIEKSADKVDHVKYRFVRKDGSVGMMDDYGHFSHSESFGDIYYVFTQDITEQDKEERESRENIIRIMALEDNFESLYDVSLENGEYSLYVKGQTFCEKINTKLTENNEFFSDTLINVERVVYPEDREAFRRVVNRDFFRKILAEQSYYDCYYRLLADDKPMWFRMRFVYKNDEKKNVIIGIFNAEEEMSAREHAAQTRKDLIAKMSGTESTYIVIPAEDSFTVIERNNYLEKNYPPDESFTDSINRYIETDVYEPDRKWMREALSIQSIASHVEEDNEYVVCFRDISGGNPRWYEMHAVRLSDSEILFGFSDKDEVIIRQMLFEELSESYFGLYYVDAAVNTAYVIKTGHPDITGEAGTYINYTELLQKIAQVSEDESAEFMRTISDINYLKQFFRTEDKGYYTYKSYVFEGNKWVNATGLVLARDEEGVPTIFAIGFSLLDEESGEKEEARLKLQKASKELEAEIHHNVVLNQIIKAGSWLFRFDEGNNVVGAEFTAECLAVIRNDVEDGYQWLRLIHPEDSERVQESFIACTADTSCNTDFDVEYRIRSRNGEYHWIHSAGRMKRQADGSGEFYGICIDIEDTVRKREEQQKQLKDALIMAEAANRSKTEFFSNMSHDIRTPMNAITGFTKMARKYLHDKDKIDDYLEKIDISSQQLLKLINQVLEMARIESGRIELEEKPVDVWEEFGSSVTVLSEQAKANGLEFRHMISGVRHNNVLADKARLSSITFNVVGNAMKYTLKGGHIDFVLSEIEARKEGYATFVLTVADTGIGMSREYQKILFEPFTREKTSAVSRIQGTGLGMSIVKELVDLMGGEITVQSEIGKGTRFDITLDFRIDEEAGERKEKEAKRQHFSFEGKKILLVEDNELNREIALDILNEEGIVVEEAEDGVIAVEMLKQKGPGYYDFILMDIQMPIMNGYDATREIRRMYPESMLPIIALSANAFFEDKERCIAAGMNGHVAKPVNPKELFGVLEMLY